MKIQYSRPRRSPVARDHLYYPCRTRSLISHRFKVKGLKVSFLDHACDPCFLIFCPRSKNFSSSVANKSKSFPRTIAQVIGVFEQIRILRFSRGMQTGFLGAEREFSPRRDVPVASPSLRVANRHQVLMCSVSRDDRGSQRVGLPLGSYAVSLRLSRNKSPGDCSHKPKDRPRKSLYSGEPQDESEAACLGG